MSQRKIAVLGTGSWGTAVAVHLAGAGHDVRLWGRRADFIEELARTRMNSRYLPEIRLPDSIAFTADLARATASTDLIACVVPTQKIRGTLQDLVAQVPPRVPIVSLSKGIENGTLLLPTQILAQLFGPDRSYGVLAGPSHAEEVVRGLPASIVGASSDPRLAHSIQEIFSTKRLRIYTNPDVLGVELGAALKNVIALAAGTCDGLGFGDNTKAALLTRGLVEIARLGVAMGARRDTFSGLSGIGDLLTTCFSPFGRNRAVGLAIGQGKKLQDILADSPMVAEGVPTTKSVLALAQKHQVEMPITEQVSAVLFDGKDPRLAVQDLMMRKLVSEAEVLS